MPCGIKFGCTMMKIPTHFRKLSERLEAIIKQLKDNWNALEEALRKFIEEELEREGKQTVPGLDPRLHAPFFRHAERGD